MKIGKNIFFAHFYPFYKLFYFCPYCDIIAPNAANPFRNAAERICRYNKGWTIDCWLPATFWICSRSWGSIPSASTATRATAATWTTATLRAFAFVSSSTTTTSYDVFFYYLVYFVFVEVLNDWLQIEHKNKFCCVVRIKIVVVEYTYIVTSIVPKNNFL